MQSIVSTVCPSEMRDWSKVTMETDPCIGVTRRALSDVMDKIKLEVNRLSKSGTMIFTHNHILCFPVISENQQLFSFFLYRIKENRKIHRYCFVNSFSLVSCSAFALSLTFSSSSPLVDVNLSFKTAHPFLAVSDDRKQVRHTNKLQEVPDNPKRFDRVANVLAKESFSSGRYYWKVEVGEKMEWNLGVVRQSVNRKGKFTVCPANGFWILSLKSGGQYMANTSPVTPIALEQRPSKVGVFLDCTEGRASFYCTETGVHIYTFTDAFTDRLHPFFSPGRLHGGKNAAPLIICSSCCSI